MDYAERAPDRRLAARVACHWRVEAHGPHLVLPDGCMDILFEDGRATLVGTSTVAFSVPPSGPVFGVRFAPGEAFAIAGGALVDATVELSAWREVAERIAEGADPVRTVEHRLFAIAPRATDHRVRRAVDTLLRAPATRVDRLARGLGLSERQLERIFTERVGVAPKQLARTVRLQRVLALDGTLAARAAAAGFADQAHLAREVKRLTGLTSTALLATAAWPVTMSDSFKRPAPRAATTGA